MAWKRFPVFVACSTCKKVSHGGRERIVIDNDCRECQGQGYSMTLVSAKRFKRMLKLEGDKV